MRLKIELTGHLEHIVISALPSAFITRIFRHCMGKNNTPYFANNCFKGIMYFDREMAAKLASQVDFTWRTWLDEDRFYRRAAFCYETYMDVTVSRDKDILAKLTSSDLPTTVTPVNHAAMRGALGQGEVLILLGSQDKGSVSYVLDGFTDDFDPARLMASLDSFEDFRLQDQLITGLLYDGRELSLERGPSTGKSMIDPVLISAEGQELDLYDFLE